MAVIQLVTYSARDTIDALRTLLAMAIRGELRGVALCFRKSDGTEHSTFTGSYKASPASALNASLRLSAELMHSNAGQDA